MNRKYGYDGTWEETKAMQPKAFFISSGRDFDIAHPFDQKRPFGAAHMAIA
jgi:hypothetical protein